MRYIFLDESGELGFGEKSSKYFIISLLSCDESEIYDFRRIIKKARSKVIKKQLKRYPEIKGNNSPDSVRNEVLTRFMKTKSEIFVIILDKSKVCEYLKDKKNKLYNYISNLVLNECSFEERSVCLIVDRSKSNRSLRDDFDSYIRKNFSNHGKINKLEIKHENSQNEAGLQVLDFVSWSIFRNYEYKDSKFMEIIKDKIVIKKELFEKDYPDPRD